MRHLLLVSLLALAIPATAEAGRIHVRGAGNGSDSTDLSLNHGQNDSHGHGHGLGLGGGSMDFPPGPPTGFPPGPPPDLHPPGLGLGHGGFPRTRFGNHFPAPVPEPGTAVLLVGGLLGLAWKSRARR